MAPLLIGAIYYFAKLLDILIFVRILLSWFPINRNNPLIQLLYSLTEPILAPIRNMIRKSPLGGPGMMLDFSPIIAYFFIEVVQYVLIEIVRTFLL